jgi:hypothetical protein
MPEADDPDLLDLLQPTEADRVLDELEKQRPDQQQALEATAETKGR